MSSTSNTVTRFRDEGYLLLDEAVTPAQLAALRADVERWQIESLGESTPYGRMMDGRPRFDLAPDHGRARSGLRRVGSPAEVSDACLDVLRNAPVLDTVAELIGPDVAHSNGKMNLKQPGGSTAVDWHQDFAFEPHTNDDLLAVLIFLDDVSEASGPLQVVPGSHRGPVHAHWHDGVFTGAVAPDVAARARREAVSVVGPAGSACLMHTRLLHGSAPNRSGGPRTLYILTYRSEDARPLQANHIPSRFDGEVVRGRATGRIRCTGYEMAMPEMPKEASFFGQQAKGQADTG